MTTEKWPAKWQVMQCDLDQRPIKRTAIGLIALAGDTVIESDMRALLQPTNADTYVTRISFPFDMSPDSLQSLDDSLPAAASLLLPGEPLDVVAFGCTSGAMAIGPEALRARISGVRSDAQITDPTTACLRALSALGVKRAALLTPYPDSVNALVYEYVTSHGIEVTACGTFRSRLSAVLRRTPPTRIPPEAVFDAAVTLGRSEVDGILISCTGLRCLPVLAKIEREIGKPVVTSNQALAWHCLRLANCARPVQGFGRLLESPP